MLTNDSSVLSSLGHTCIIPHNYLVRVKYKEPIGRVVMRGAMATFLSWRNPPQPGTIEVNILGESAWPGFLNAEFLANGKKYALIVEKGFIDQSGKKMSVFIIADIDETDCVIELPGESIGAGNRVQIGVSEVANWEQIAPR